MDDITNDVELFKALELPSTEFISKGELSHIDHSNRLTDFTLDKFSDLNFKFELDLGLALPFRYHCNDEDLKNSHSATVVKKMDTDGKIEVVKITTQSNEGPLQSVENDVLLTLLTMAFEQHKSKLDFDMDLDIQNGTRVYYTRAEICRRLGIDLGSSTRIKAAIDRIKSQQINFKQMEFTPGIKRAGVDKFNDINDNYRIILRDGRLRVSQDSDIDTYKEVFYVDLDPFVVNNLFKDYFSTINKDQYLSLNAGTQRRLMIFLQSKRMYYGEVFTFELNEVVQILGLDGRQRVKRTVLNVLDMVHKGLGNFDYLVKEKQKSIKLKSSCDNYTVLIQFKPDIKMVEKYEPFYQALCDYYGEDELRKIDIQEIDVLSLRKEINSRFLRTSKNKTDEYIFGKQTVNVGEFVIDVTLFQIFHANYNVKSFKAFSRTMGQKLSEGLLEVPDKYRSFLYDRNKENKTKADLEQIKRLEKAKKIQLEEEDKLFNASFTELYKNMILTSESTKAKIRDKAVEELKSEGRGEGDLLYQAEVDMRMFQIAKKMTLMGDLMDIRGKSSNSLNGNSSKKTIQ